MNPNDADSAPDTIIIAAQPDVTAAAQARLTALEAEVQAGQAQIESGYMRMMAALVAIYEGRLWCVSHPDLNWGDYTLKRFGFGDRRWAQMQTAYNAYLKHPQWVELGAKNEADYRVLAASTQGVERDERNAVRQLVMEVAAQAAGMEDSIVTTSHIKYAGETVKEAIITKSVQIGGDQYPITPLADATLEALTEARAAHRAASSRWRVLADVRPPDVVVTEADDATVWVACRVPKAILAGETYSLRVSVKDHKEG